MGFSWGGAAKGGMSGATTGTAISPGWGTAIGAILGAALGGFSGDKKGDTSGGDTSGGGAGLMNSFSSLIPSGGSGGGGGNTEENPQYLSAQELAAQNKANGISPDGSGANGGGFGGFNPSMIGKALSLFGGGADSGAAAPGAAGDVPSIVPGGQKNFSSPNLMGFPSMMTPTIADKLRGFMSARRGM